MKKPKNGNREATGDQEVGNDALVEAYFEQLPWLSTHYEMRKIPEVHIGEINYKILRRELLVGECPAFMHDDVRLFTKSGNKIGQIGVKMIWNKKWLRRPQMQKKFFPETVYGGIERLKHETGQETYYIIALWANKLQIAIPKGNQSFRDVINHELQLAREEVKKELKLN